MTTVTRYCNMQCEDLVRERMPMTTVVPESELETDLLLDWVRRELREDLGDLTADDYDLLSKFHRACDYIHYKGGDTFIYQPRKAQRPFLLYVHPFRGATENGQQAPQEFELYWEQDGVVYSLFEVSVIEDMMKVIH